MKDIALVSILTPFKNTEIFIAECLDSILSQTYQNWELIIVDDHSTDASRSIVNCYAEKNHRIKLYKNEGDGIIPALRTAFKHCSGDFISRMDSDDIMKRHKIERMVGDLKANGPKHIALGLVKYFNEHGVNDGYIKYEKWLNRLTKDGSNFSEIYKECVIPSPCWMVYREDFENSGGFQPNLYPEDYDLTFRFYEAGLKCIPSQTLLHLWRDYPTRTSRTHEHYAQNHFLDIKYRYLIKLDYDKNRPLTLWGAGFKGKVIAKKLAEENIPFYWICDNPKKVGKKIYGILLCDFKKLQDIQNPQSIVTVANKEAQSQIRQYFKEQEMVSMEDYYFFC